MKTGQIIKKNIKTYDDYPIKGVKYFDLNPLYAVPAHRFLLVEGCIEILSNLNPQTKNLWHTEYDYIAIVESRGFIIGSILAERFRKGLILLRSKPGRLPGETSLVKHTLEYGDSQMEVQKGEGKVLIFDDVLATGGTASAAKEVLELAGYTPMSALFLVELSYCKPKLDLDHKSVITYRK